MVWICPACGGHVAADDPPEVCAVCADERQFVPPGGQRWTTLEGLADDGYRTDVRDLEPGLIGIGTQPDIGVGQRGLLLQSDGGNILWDPPAFVDDAAFEAVRAAGGLTAVSSSHPHMYGAIVDWAEMFDAEIVLPHDDAAWLRRPTQRVRRWSGTERLAPGVTLIQTGGHFPGSAVLHWADGADGLGILATGDTIYVAPGLDRVTFLWSAPNRLPLWESAVRRIADAVDPYPYERLYGGWWWAVIVEGAEMLVQRDAQRYIEVLRGEI
jgi:glyoxylase-like metal-dependent hydrolase (beta-lactamase superfamily II)